MKYLEYCAGSALVVSLIILLLLFDLKTLHFPKIKILRLWLISYVILIIIAYIGDGGFDGDKYSNFLGGLTFFTLLISLRAIPVWYKNRKAQSRQ